MFLVFRLESDQELLLNVVQIWYLPTVCFKSWLRELRLATAFSSCEVAVAV